MGSVAFIAVGVVVAICLFCVLVLFLDHQQQPGDEWTDLVRPPARPLRLSGVPPRPDAPPVSRLRASYRRLVMGGDDTEGDRGVDPQARLSYFDDNFFV